MTRDPMAWIEPFAEAGADMFIFCFDSLRDRLGTIKRARSAGKSVGISLLVTEPPGFLECIVPWADIDQVTLVGTPMGTKGTLMDPSIPRKIGETRAVIERRTRAKVEIQVDGGIRRDTVPLLHDAGADWIVPGSLMFGEGSRGNAPVARFIVSRLLRSCRGWGIYHRRARRDEEEKRKENSGRRDAMREINEITGAIIGAAIEVHRALGPGLLESTYEACLVYELREHGFHVEYQKPLPVVYKGVTLDCGYRIDLLVEHCVIVELKSVDQIIPIHLAQLLSYLKLSGNPVGLLINFNVNVLIDGVKHIANQHAES